MSACPHCKLVHQHHDRCGHKRLSREVRHHGTFSASPEAVERFSHMSRPAVLKYVLAIYEGTRSGPGAKASDWRGYSKADLVYVAADGYGAKG